MNAPPGGAPKPPPAMWQAMCDAAADRDEYRFNVLRAQYLGWLHEQDIEGHPDPLHGHPPTETDNELEDEGIF